MAKRILPFSLLLLVLLPAATAAHDGPGAWSVRVAESWLRTPVVADGRVFIGGGIGSRDFFAFDARTGRSLWRTSVADVGPTSALYHQGRIIFGSESCHVHVLDAETGAIVWERFLGDPLTAAPSVGAGLVFSAYLGHEGWSLAALRLEDGAPRWNRLLGRNVVDAPIFDDGRLYLTLEGGDVLALDAQSGHELWRHEGEAVGAPAVVGSELRFVAWPHNAAGEPTRLRMTLSGYETARRETFEAVESRLSDIGACPWSVPTRIPLSVAPGGAVRADTSGVPDGARSCLAVALRGIRVTPIRSAVVHELRLTRGLQYVQRLDARTGRALGQLGEVDMGRVPRYAARGGGNWFWSYEGPRVVDDEGERIEVVGDMVRLRDTRSVLGAETVRWEHRAEGGATLPAILDDHIVFGNGAQLVVRTRSTGGLLQATPVEGHIASQPVVGRGWVYATTRDGYLVARRMTDILGPRAEYAMWGGGPARNGR